MGRARAQRGEVYVLTPSRPDLAHRRTNTGARSSHTKVALPERLQVTLKTYADLFDTDLDDVGDALDAAYQRSVSSRGPKHVQPLRKASR